MFEENNVHVIVRALKQHLALQGKTNASAARIGKGGTESGERGGVRTCERRTRERASERPIRRGAYSARRWRYGRLKSTRVVDAIDAVTHLVTPAWTPSMRLR